LTLVGANGTGWYIAIAAFPVYAAGALGLLFGAFVGSLGLSVQSDSGLGEAAAKGQAAIVFTHQPKSRVELRQPKGVNVLYVQVGDKWIMHPENAPTIGRKIVFWPAGQNGAEIDLHIDPESSGSFS
jgi:hypothetical protein